MYELYIHQMYAQGETTMTTIIALILTVISVCLFIRAADRRHTRLWERSVWDAYGNGPRPPEEK
jgi:multisubunit Na+/H+ antiporter MnhG subunit